MELIKNESLKNTLFYCLLLVMFTNSLVAQQDAAKENEIRENYILLRPNANLGFLNNNLISSFGLRTLLQAGDNKVYGAEFSYFQNHKTKDDFYTVGIILEQKLFNWFNMSIGTIGYFNFGELSENAVGLTSNLGWEPNSNKRFSPFITYRSDFIFSSELQSINALNLGVNIKL